MTNFGIAIRWISVQAGGQMIYPVFSAAMLAMMVFVTSPLNDLGDIKGDKKAGRRTIPIVLGKENTIRLSMLIALGIGFSSWILYAISNFSFESNGIELQNKINASTIALPLTLTGTCVLVIFHLLNLLKRIEE